MTVNSKLFEVEMKNRNYSYRTIKIYTHMIQKYDIFKKFGFVSEEEGIRKFLSEYIISTEQRRLAYQAIRLFYKIVRHIDCPYVLDKIKREKRLPTVLSRNEVLKILDTIKNKKHFNMVALLYGSGLRVGEVVKLKI